VSEETPAEEYAFVGDITDYWTYTQVRDRLMLMPGLTDPAMRMYLIVRSMIGEKKKHLPGQGLRRMTIDQMCFLLSRDTGKPVSVSLMYQILTLLKDLDLMVPLDTKQDVDAGQMKGKEKAVFGILRGFLVRDLPPVPYAGWRNAWDKLNHYRPDWRENPPQPPMHVTTTVVDDNGRTVAMVSVVPQDVAFQDSGTDSEGSDQGTPPDEDPFQDSGTPFQDSGTPFQEAGTDSPTTSEDAAPKEGSPTTVPKKSDGPDGRSPGGCRRPSTGSSGRASESGCAASGKDSPSPSSQNADRAPKTKGPVKLNDEQRQARDAILPLLPADLREALGTVIPQNICQDLVDALAAGLPRERTPQQLVQHRLMPRWNGYWASRFYAGDLTPEVNGKKRKPFGPLVEMLKDTGECSNLWCEDRHDFALGDGCQNCEMRKEDKKADRDRERRLAQEDTVWQARRGEDKEAAEGASTPLAEAGDAAAAQMPSQRSMVLHTPRVRRECAEDTCALRLPEGWEDELCQKCRNRADRAAQIYREQKAAAARYEAPSDEFASVGPPPF
jgi:hypothetical protein